MMTVLQIPAISEMLADKVLDYGLAGIILAAVGWAAWKFIRQIVDAYIKSIHDLKVSNQLHAKSTDHLADSISEFGNRFEYVVKDMKAELRDNRNELIKRINEHHQEVIREVKKQKL